MGKKSDGSFGAGSVVWCVEVYSTPILRWGRADDSTKYDKVKDKFDKHFVKRRNIIYERAKFNKRHQEAASQEINSLNVDPWKTEVIINGTKVEFKVDTGADVSVIPDTVFNGLKAVLQDTKRTLTGPGQHKLNVCGALSATLKANNLETTQEIFVVKGLTFPLLGRPAIKARRTVNMIDDTLVYGRDQKEHDERLEKVLARIEEAGITLNPNKCEFSKRQVTFLGHVIDESGIRPDPTKIKAIVDMAEPTNVSELRRFLGMTNQLGKFSSKIADRNIKTPQRSAEYKEHVVVGKFTKRSLQLPEEDSLKRRCTVSTLRPPSRNSCVSRRVLLWPRCCTGTTAERQNLATCCLPVEISIQLRTKDLTSADTLSRAPTTEPVAKDYALEEDGNLYVNLIVNGLPASEKRLDEIRVHLHEDESIIAHLKSIFSRHGIPEKMVTDNGPQYASNDFANFAKDYSFVHVTSSPRYAQSNGEAERAVQTVKRLFNKSTDLHLALLAYRATPLQQGYSPAQLLMSRNLRTTVPVLPCRMKPVVVDSSHLRKRDGELKQKQKEHYDSRHRVQDLPVLEKGDEVYIPQMKTSGTVQQECGERSVLVSTPKGQLRRNRRHLNSLPKPAYATPQEEADQAGEAPPQMSQTTDVQPPTAKEQGTLTTRRWCVCVVSLRWARSLTVLSERVV
ncbi:hypothetical protein QZH41_003408 [Actinostola sp. cb2023]|nr:hypothetical protein QZH41_003408 [Actinostola sp. cb2023]